MRTILMSLFLLPLGINVSNGQDPFLQDLLLRWDNASEYTMAVVSAMPAEQYEFRPVEEVYTYSRQVVHMANNINWLCSSYLGGEDFIREEPEGKEAVEAYLQRCLDYAQETLENLDMSTLDEEVDFFAGPMSRRRILFLLNDHLTHHRGQIIIYLRMQGIQPARYVGW